MQMPTSSRRAIIPEASDCVVHAVSRCVRRAWLCGRDPYNGRDYEHRRDWVRERVRELAGVFAVEVCAYAIMSNHSHLVLWCRPSVAETWGPEEVARRWLRLFGRGGAAEKARQEAELAADARRVAVCRGRLGSVSWFMRCLNERIARRANAEDGCTGRFWEGRFKCQLLEDEGAVLACMAYVDLNPVRAKLADTLEASTFTSVHDRLVARKARAVLAAAEGLAGRRGAGRKQVPATDGKGTKVSKAGITPAQARLLDKARAEAAADSWLCALGGGAGASARPMVPGVSEEGYLALVDWTGRSLAEGKRGKLPTGLRPLLESLDLETERWVETVAGYGGLFHRVAGRAESLGRKAVAMGQRWLAGVRASREVFRPAAVVA